MTEMKGFLIGTLTYFISRLFFTVLGFLRHRAGSFAGGFGSCCGIELLDRS